MRDARDNDEIEVVPDEVTEPAGGEVEHVPLKVVPMYVEAPEAADEPVEREEQTVEPEVAAPRRRTPLVGIGALAGAVVAAVLQGVAVGVASAGDYPLASGLAVAAIVLSILAFLAGLVAVIANLGRRTGVVALVLAVFANPVVLLALLSWVGGS